MSEYQRLIDEDKTLADEFLSAEQRGRGDVFEGFGTRVLKWVEDSHRVGRSHPSTG